MINTSIQLKNEVRKLAQGDGEKAKILYIKFFMERFLVRLSKSKYRDNFILKGGVLITSIVGIDKRSTLDIDALIRHLKIDTKVIEMILIDIINQKTNDNVFFNVARISNIMDECEYSGFRVTLNATLDKIKNNIQIDFSAGDIITPAPINLNYTLLFNQEKINIMAYNIETIISEKFQTIIVRNVANTRMRDFYDIHLLMKTNYDYFVDNFNCALLNTCKKRNTIFILNEWQEVLDDISINEQMQDMWSNYQMKFEYANNIEWAMIIKSLYKLGSIIKCR